MPLKKVTSKEFIKIVKKESGLDLSKRTMNIHIGPFFEWDRKEKKLKEPKLIITRDIRKKNIN